MTNIFNLFSLSNSIDLINILRSTINPWSQYFPSLSNWPSEKFHLCSWISTRRISKIPKTRIFPIIIELFQRSSNIFWFSEDRTRNTFTEFRNSNIWKDENRAECKMTSVDWMKTEADELLKKFTVKRCWLVEFSYFYLIRLVCVQVHKVSITRKKNSKKNTFYVK